MAWNKVYVKIVLAVTCFFMGCSLYARNKSPYLINAQMVMEDSDAYDIAGLDLYIFNKTDKCIRDFTVVFYVYDADGNPPEGMKNNLVIPVEAEIEADDELSACICLDKYLTFIPEEPFQIDFLYLSKITYEDGSEWSDPFGLNYF